MAEFLTPRHRKDLSTCVQSILRSTGGSITSASDLQCFFDSLLSTTRVDNAQYAYEWNGHGRDKLSRLPTELLVHCLSYLDLATWLRATLVSRRWHKMVETPAIWSKVTIRYPFKAMANQAKVAWLSKYLAKSAQATLDIEWLETSICEAEIAVLAANMYRTAHFEAQHSMPAGIASASLSLPAPHLETFCFSISPSYEETAGVFNFENAFGTELPRKLRKIKVGHFTLPTGTQSLPAVTNFEGILRSDDESNHRLFTFFPSLTSVMLLYQTRPVIPRGPFPATLHTLRIAHSGRGIHVATEDWESLLSAIIHPVRTISIDHIGALEIPFELFKRAVSHEWHLAACPVPAYYASFSTRFKLTPANISSSNTVCHSFAATDLIWEIFLSSPAGATSVAQNTLLVSLQLTPTTFSALLKASADLPALRIFTLYVQDAAYLPGRYSMPSSDSSCSPVKVIGLREFILELDRPSHGVAALWFTRFLPSHIHEMFAYSQQRLDRLAFIGEYTENFQLSGCAWGLVARLTDKLHVGRSLHEPPLPVPNEDVDVSEGSDWEPEEEDYSEDEGRYDYSYAYEEYDEEDDDDFYLF